MSRSQRPASAPPTVLVAHPSADLYGSDRVLLESVDALVEQGWGVVVTVPSDGPLVPHLRRRGAEVVLCRTPVLRRSALRPRGAVRLLADVVAGTVAGARLLRRHRPAVVYVNTVTIPWWFLLARAAGSPVLAHVHEAESSSPPAVRRVLALPLLLATAVVANSRFTRGVLLASVPRLARRTTVVHNAVPGPGAPAPAREQVEGPVRVVCAGRLSPRKGAEVVLEAVAVLVERGVDVRLELVGDVFPGYEWFEQRLRERAAAAPLAGRVHLVGFRADVWPHLAGADVVVVPSLLDESFGNAAVEAVLAARPVVVSDLGGLREAAGDYGCARFVAPRDATALADGVQALLADWPRVREVAVGDSATAAARHAAPRYRAELVQVVSGMLSRRA